MGKHDVDNRTIANSVKAEVVNIDGVKRLKTPSGIMLEKPYSYYIDIVMVITNTLLSEYPELRRYITRLSPVFTFKFKTFATGYGYIFINPYFLDAIMKKSKEVFNFEYALPVFVYMHEIYHNLFGHMEDGKRNISTYPDLSIQNIAMDYTINGIIEILYDMHGATEAIGGYINSNYNNKDWTWVYSEIESKNADMAKEPYKIIKDMYDKVSDDSNNKSGSLLPPSNNDIRYSRDFIEGYKSRYLEIKNIIEDAIRNGKGIQEIIDILKAEAKKKGLDIFEAYMTYPTSNESYNRGVEAAYADAINKLKMVLDNTGASKDGDYQSAGDTKYNEELNNAVDELFNQLNSGKPSEPSEGQEDDSSENDNSQDMNDESESKDPDKMSASEREDVMSDILKERGLSKNEDTIPPTQKAEDLRNHLENLPVEGEEANELKNNMKQELDKKIPISKVNTGIDWKEVLSDFITKCVKEKTPNPNINAIAKTIDYYKGNNIIDTRYKYEKSDGANHIVICLDNSGSVCSSNSVPDFLGALVEIFDTAISNDTVVDFIQFDETIKKCTRVVHIQGETIDEIDKVSSATGGGTDYVDIMKESELLVLRWDEEDPRIGKIRILPEFSDREAEGEYDIFDIGPAVCSIVFTDTDFYYGGKYEDMDEEMLDKMKFVVLTDGNTIKQSKDLDKYDILYINRNNWNYGKK